MIGTMAAVASDNLTVLSGWRQAAGKRVDMPDCSLIVATYQRPSEAEVLVTSLAAMADVPGEVVFVDGSPGHETEEALRKAVRDVRLPFELIYVRSPKGLTKQRNVGVDLSTKPFVYFLDDDAAPRQGYFTELRRVLVNDEAGTIGAVGACIVNEINKPMNRRWRMRRALRIIPRVQPYVYNDVGTSAPSGLLKPFTGTRDVDIFPGGACLIRRTIFSSERFSEFFAGYSYGEDVEMSLRIRRKWRVVCCGDAHVWHYGIQSKGGRPAPYTKGRMEVRNRYFIWKRYSPHASLLNRIRFYLDLCFLFVMDLAWFAARPWRREYLAHALGLLSGAANCVISPPESMDPAPVKRYRLASVAGEGGF
jgi:GT2 family glycosyltransferase